MVAIKNLRRKIALLLTAAALALQPGCAPPGPRALLNGDALLRKGKPAEAVEKLKRATELLPGDPRAWNLLGLAYHRSGQPALAVQAYRHALAKDRSNIVNVAHYNLGCLLLEQNNPAGALDEFRSYTLITNSTAGLVKLATAQLRLRQWDAAEKTLLAALKLEPKNTEALNSLGVIHAQRNQREAAQSRFNAALSQQPKYSSALLNSALLAQQVPAMKPMALQRYREFLAVQPSGPQADTVKLLVRQLESELAPPPVAAVRNVTRTNSSLPATNIRSAAIAVTNPSSQVVASQILVVKSNPPPVGTRTNQAVANPTNKAPALAAHPVTVVAVTNEAPVKIASAPAPAPRPAVPSAPLPPAAIQESEVPLPLLSTPGDDEKKKPGLFARLNPFGGKAKSTTNEAPRSVVVNPAIERLPDAEGVRSVESKETIARYSYLSPEPPAKGNRFKAERALQGALGAQRAGRKSDAQLQLENAVTADPSYFDAHYNAALFAFQSGDLKRALAGWETALALEPDSINARYSFALALKQANYPRDAAVELEKIIEGKPEDARAHLALGNLYAQTLHEPAKARVHYQKALSIDPRSPQASAIRFWLAANP